MAKIHVGLDIGALTTRVVAVNHDGDKYRLVSLGSIYTPQPGLVSDSDTDLEAVGNAIKKLFEATVSEARKKVSKSKAMLIDCTLKNLSFLVCSTINCSGKRFIDIKDMVNLP